MRQGVSSELTIHAYALHLEDPTGKSDEIFKRVIKEIEEHILQLKSYSQK